MKPFIIFTLVAFVTLGGAPPAFAIPFLRSGAWASPPKPPASPQADAILPAIVCHLDLQRGVLEVDTAGGRLQLQAAPEHLSTLRIGDRALVRITGGSTNTLEGDILLLAPPAGRDGRVQPQRPHPGDSV